RPLRQRIGGGEGVELEWRRHIGAPAAGGAKRRQSPSEAAERRLDRAVTHILLAGAREGRVDERRFGMADRVAEYGVGVRQCTDLPPPSCYACARRSRRGAVDKKSKVRATKKPGARPGFDNPPDGGSVQIGAPPLAVFGEDDPVCPVHPRGRFKADPAAFAHMGARDARRCFFARRLDHFAAARRGALARPVIVEGVPNVMAHKTSRISRETAPTPKTPRFSFVAFLAHYGNFLRTEF